MYDTMIQDHNTDRQRNYTLDSATTRIESYSSTTFRYVKLEILTPGQGTFRVGALGKTVALLHAEGSMLIPLFAARLHLPKTSALCRW